MATIKKVTKGYQTRVSTRKDGKLVQKQRTFRTLKQAQDFIKRGGKSPSPKNRKVVKNDFLEFATYFYNWYKVYKYPQLQQRTRTRYEVTYRDLKQYFKHKHITEITRIDYQKFINWYGSNHAKITVSKVNAIVRACVKNSMLDDLILKDFTQGVTLVWNESRTRHVEYLNMEELELFISSVVHGINPKYPVRYILLTAIYTGARVGEILALHWNDIDTKHNLITINKSWNYNTNQLQKTKTISSNRVLKVNHMLIKYLQMLKINNSKWVFFSPITDKLPSNSGINKMVKDCLFDAGLDKPGYHFHSLRHTHVAYLLTQGVDIYTISKRLGHTDISITTKKYAYVMDELQAKKDSEIETILNRLNL